MPETITVLDSFFGNGDPVVTVAYALTLFVVGSVVASFSCLVAYRMTLLEDEQSLLRAISFPPSHCDGCGRRLTVVELMPVIGWILRRGRCPTCGARIPARYPVMEFLLGAACAATPFVFGGIADAAPAVFVLLAGFLVAIIDWDNSMIPEEITWVILFAGLFLSPAEAEIEYRVAGAAIGAVGGWVMTTVPGWLKGVDTRAWGDVAMAAGVGAWVGCFLVPSALMAAAVIHFVICLTRGAGRDDSQVWTPFGPALMVVFAAAMVAHPWLTPLLRPDL
ncbi:prepilin peptidase [Agrobacterium rubi]|nr:prepilin peptidase [Agrobacterium rubi]NTF24502.1 prepilin peptidase [Agrobacterium rubi]